MSKIAEVLMGLAIDSARRGMKQGQSPFGCAIRLADGQIISKHNTVLNTYDATAHAEVNAIRESNRAVRSPHLLNARVATTCEPCPMCMAALHWARVKEVYYGASIADAAAAGFNEIDLPASQVATAGANKVQLQAGVLTGECQQLFHDWRQGSSPQVY